jgi:Tfp pilus assembly protein PilF
MRISPLALIALLAIPSGASAQITRPNSETGRANLHYRLGWESLHAENWLGAMREFQQAIDIDRSFKLAYYGLGRSHMGLRQFKDAARAYETCRDLYQAQAGEKFKSTLEADKIREQDQEALQVAINQLSNKTTQIQSTQTQIRQLRTEQQSLQMKRDQARDISIASDVPAFVSLALGSAYFRQERMADAEREYRAAIDSDPTAGEAHNNLAVVYMLTGRLDESAKEVTLAERAGFKVNSQFKKDLEDKRKGKT